METIVSKTHIGGLENCAYSLVKVAQMKIVYFGNDEYITCLRYLIDKGHELCGVFVNNINNCSLLTKKLCNDKGIEVLQYKPREQALLIYYKKGAELFLSVDYQYVIPLADADMLGVNIYPTLLTRGRGHTTTFLAGALQRLRRDHTA